MSPPRSAPQAKKVQELVVAIIRQFTEAYGPLILVLGEDMCRGGGAQDWAGWKVHIVWLGNGT